MYRPTERLRCFNLSSVYLFVCFKCVEPGASNDSYTSKLVSISDLLLEINYSRDKLNLSSYRESEAPASKLELLQIILFLKECMRILYWIIKHVLKWNTNWLLSINKIMARCFKIYYAVIFSQIHVCPITDGAVYCDIKYQMLIKITIWFLKQTKCMFTYSNQFSHNGEFRSIGTLLPLRWLGEKKKCPNYPELTLNVIMFVMAREFDSSTRRWCYHNALLSGRLCLFTHFLHPHP